MNYRSFFILATFCVVAAGNALAEEDLLQQTGTRAELTEILDSISDRTGQTFLIEHRVAPTVVIGQISVDDIAYPELLVILHNNGLAAVSLESVVNIVPAAIVRQYPLPTIYEEDDSIAADEWITWVVQVERTNAKMLVPILRPLIPQQGHLVAFPDANTLIVVDRYANAKRVVELVSRLDRESSGREAPAQANP